MYKKWYPSATTKKEKKKRGKIHLTHFLSQMLFSSFTAFQDLSSRKSVKEREYRSWRGISYLPPACGLNALSLNTCMYFVQRYKPVTTVRRGARSVSAVDSAYWIPRWRRNLSLYHVAIHYIHKALANTSNIAAFSSLPLDCRSRSDFR